MSSSIGAVDGNPQQQKLVYSITLSSDEDHDTYITGITPVLADADNAHVINGSANVPVNKTLLAHSYLKIDGEVLINSTGLSKEEISAAGKMTGVKISSSEIVNLQ
jgi:hypothetical protein